VAVPKFDPNYIVITGARHHNLRVDSLKIPKNQLVVLTGVSGSGKSSLAFDTLYAEGQRRYVESLSSYARQFLGQLEKPEFDHIRGLSPTIAIDQKVAGHNPRSTVGTITEVYDYLRLLFARIGVQHCPECQTQVQALATEQILDAIAERAGEQWLLVPLLSRRKGEHRELLASLAVRGFVRVRLDGAIHRLDALPVIDRKRAHDIELVIDRIEPKKTSRTRLADSVATALREGHGSLLVVAAREPKDFLRLGTKRACPSCQRAFPELVPQHFSFNSPLGMCSACNGLGIRAEIDPKLLVPDPTISIRQGAIVPLAGVMARGGGINFGMFEALQAQCGLDLDRPWQKLSARHQRLVLFGTGEQLLKVEWDGSHGRTSWPMQFEGVVRSMTRRFRETKSEEMRRYYAQYLSETPCGECAGTRLNREARAVRIGGASMIDLVAKPVEDSLATLRGLGLTGADAQIAEEILREICGRLEFLVSVGLGYLSLDRQGASLSGGEAQRIRLAAQLGSELSGVLYVLDEPSIGMHPSDTARLIATLKRLRDCDNTVVVVEHERATIEAADHIIDFGPGAGEHGGKVVFEGTPKQLRAANTLTGRYLSGRMTLPAAEKQRPSRGQLVVHGASENNLKGIDVAFPLGQLVAVTGVSGAGKSTLVSDILYPALARQLTASRERVGRHEGLSGVEQIDKVILVDQSPIGRTPRSNPATYTKVMDDIRELFSQTPEARALGFDPGYFSFNVAKGRCEACEGDGVRRVEMHFLPDVFVTCEVCRGRRYQESTLAVRYRGLHIAEILDRSVDQALEVFSAHPSIVATLRTLSDVGLGYMKLGQPAPTLSGGEAQRVKLSRELGRRDTGRTLYVLDEPTTGLHMDDVAKLLGVLNRLVDAGNTVVVIEHDIGVIAAADHVIDLGPEGGAKGGRIVATGRPAKLATMPGTRTGAELKRYFADAAHPPKPARRAPAPGRRRA